MSRFKRQNIGHTSPRKARGEHALFGVHVLHSLHHREGGFWALTSPCPHIRPLIISRQSLRSTAKYTKNAPLDTRSTRKASFLPPCRQLSTSTYCTLRKKRTHRTNEKGNNRCSARVKRNQVSIANNSEAFSGDTTPSARLATPKERRRPTTT